MSNYIVREDGSENVEIVNICTDSDCYICFENNRDLIHPCICKGTNNGVHLQCLEKWLEIGKKDHCLVCKYNYKYRLLFDPSVNRFWISCINFNKLEFSENLNILLIALIIICINTALLTLIIAFVDNLRSVVVVPILSILELLQIVVLKRIDKTLNFISVSKYSQLLFSFIVYLFLIIQIDYNYNYCENYCETKKTICDNSCDYYPIYRANDNMHFFTLLYQSIILGTICLVDLGFKIKKALCIRSVIPYRNGESTG